MATQHNGAMPSPRHPQPSERSSVDSCAEGSVEGGVDSPAGSPSSGAVDSPTATAPEASPLGALLLTWMQEAAVDRADFAAWTGITHRQLNRLLTGQEVLTTMLAAELEEITEIPAHILLAAERQHRS